MLTLGGIEKSLSLGYLRVQHIKPKRQGIRLIENLNIKLPFRSITRRNSVPQIKSVCVCILSSKHLSLFPYQACFSLLSLPVPLDKFGVTGISDKAESMDTKAIHMPERTRNTIASHSPEQGMESTGLLTKEIPGGIMSSSCLGNLSIWSGFDGMDQIRKKNCILNEKYRDIIPDDIS